MQHRVYKLNNRLTIFGLEFSDLGVAAVSFFAFNGIVAATMDTRLNLVFIIGATFLITRIWIGVKDNVPDKFFMHLLLWLAEKDRYYATPDLEPTPVVVDVNAAIDSRRNSKRKPRKARP